MLRKDEIIVLLVGQEANNRLNASDDNDVNDVVDQHCYGVDDDRWRSSGCKRN
jgi:hypothetical protein